MISRLRRLWEELLGSLWFVPSITVLVAIVLAFAMVALDRTVGYEASQKFPLVFEAGPEGAREVLGTIAGSVITVASVAFSFTILALSLASSQYSSRIISNFIDDRTNQTVLGVLLGSFVYCLLVLRTVRVEGSSLVESTFVPSLSVTMALLIALLDLGLFILYLHHTAISVTAYHIINRVGESTVKTVRRVFPEENKQAGDTFSARGPHPASLREELRASDSGYVQYIDIERIVELAKRHDIQVEVRRRIGDFVTAGKLLAIVHSSQQLTEKVRDDIVSALVLGLRRTQERDPLFGLVQLSDVAVKALSPGINDPTTALMCLDQIERILSAVASRQAPDQEYCDSEGTPRVFAPMVNFRAMTDQAFNSIRHYGAADVHVASRMLDVIANVSEQTGDEMHWAVLRTHAVAMIETANGSVEATADRALLEEKIASLSTEYRVADWNLPLLGAGKDRD